MKRNYRGIPINTTIRTHEKVFSLLELPKDSKILDVPSGAGAFIARLKDEGYQNVYAMDIQNVMQVTHEHFREGNMNEALPFADNDLDAVVCIDGIEHISRQFDFVREVRRVLKPDGVFIVSTPNISAIRSRFRWFWTGHHHKGNLPLNELRPDPSHHIALLSYPQLRYLFRVNGLVLNKVTVNRIKWIGWVYIIFLPFISVLTWLVYRREKDARQRSINRKIWRTVLSLPVALGETLIVSTRPEKIASDGFLNGEDH